MARVPIATKPNEPFAYYTIEFRYAVGFDQGLDGLGQGNSGMMIHRINETEQGNWLLEGRFPDFGNHLLGCQAGDTFFDNAGGILIKVVSIDRSNNFADVEISASGTAGNHGYYGPNACANGYVWREGDTMDYACVPPSCRTQVRNDNAAGPARKLPNSDSCMQDFVWREAWPRDHVCVLVDERRYAQEESVEAWNLVVNDYGSKHVACRPSAAVIP